MGQDHGAILDTERLATLADIFTRPSAALGGICNLCFLSSTNLKLHVSRHLEQIVLFALPRSDYAAGDESIGGNSVDIHSNQSQKNVKGSVVEKEMLQSQPSGTAHTLSKDRDDRLGAAEAQDDDPPGEDIVHQIDVPDMVPSSWDDVTDKFSEARRGLSATAPFLERSTTAGYCNVAVLLIQWADETEERKKEVSTLQN
ncbi:hypothetical protein W97_04024 [Coniosporium apollinis CBS 100218]|uniref:Uncharacterized protein n=1 Tax=Coniosporium apollinis (strain CBS 100218) TaxID=1168221 RepID=R7YT01_CONA1|nr:uncharacterized protein W97_04024 [Coniosporium apollinis CBS 100218]EON64791.1 hypothetical protein W97_04024 [Coniosporium apollinis CBS 100218]